MCRWFNRQRCSDCSALIDGEEFNLYPAKGRPYRVCSQCWLRAQDPDYSQDLILRSWEVSHE